MSTAQTMITHAQASVQEWLSATGPHVASAAAKPLYAHVHAWDSSAFFGSGGRRVSLRLEGQYVDHAVACCKSTAEAEYLAEALRTRLDCRVER